MKKTYIKPLTAAILCACMLFLCGCGSLALPAVPSQEESSANTVQETPQSENPVQSAGTADEAAECDFSALTGLEFFFASGAGGWSTVMTVNEDGSFRGYFHDSEMGSIGEGYPNGSLYECSFTGRLVNYSVLDSQSFSLQVSGLSYDREGTEWIEDGVRHISANPYGLSEGCSLVFYSPDTPVSRLSDEQLMWLALSRDSGTLGMIAACNVTEGYAFSSYPVYEYSGDSTIAQELAEIESRAAEIENELDNASTQYEMNTAADALYRLWDDELNSIWKRLQECLDPDSMERLTAEEVAWIAYKDEQVRLEGADYEGGTMHALVCSTVAAEFTRDRVYVLAEYLR